MRGNLALRFINHSYKFADVVAFVLPKLFNSDGKGNAKDRVKGYKLAYSENLPLNSFEYPNGKKVSVATIFQIWTKVNVDKIKFIKRETCKSFIKIYSLSNGSTPSSIRNKNMLYKCDVYLPSTCFSKMGAYSNFDELPNKRGYGVVFLKNKNILKNIFYNKINWKKEAFLSTNSALNLRTSIIENALIKQGVMDKKLENHAKEIIENLSRERSKIWDNSPLSGYKNLDIDKRGSFGERLIKDVMSPKVRRIEYNDGDQGDWDIKIENKKIEIKTSSIDKNNKFQNEGLKKDGDYDSIIFVGVEPNGINIKCAKKEEINFEDLHSREERKTGTGSKWDLKKEDMQSVNSDSDIFDIINENLFDGKLKK